MSKVRSVISIFCLLCVAQVCAQSKEDIARTIVRVHSGNKYSTGFFWKNGTTVLTTLHALSSAQGIEIYVPSTGWKRAVLRKVYKAGDLVSLEVQGYTSAHYLSRHHASPPAVNTQVYTIGYNAGSESYIDRDFTVGLLEGDRLRNLLTDGSRRQISALGFPSLDMQITYLQGALLHGFSGAPVVDRQGSLVGVADGGLENGAADISWCINASHIALLENSAESLPALSSSAVNNLFAYEEYHDRSAGEAQISLGNANFRRIKTRSFSELDFTGNYSTSDAMGLRQLIAFFSSYNVNLGAFRYDVYLEENTGATVVVPEGETLQPENGRLVCGDNRIRMFVDLEQTDNIQAASQTFESNFIHPNINWIADPSWTYLTPYTDPTGTIIRRKAFVGNVQQYYLFEALAGKGQHFLGAAAFRNNMLMAPADYSKWAQYAIAIQLSTFSN